MSDFRYGVPIVHEEVTFDHKVTVFCGNGDSGDVSRFCHDSLCALQEPASFDTVLYLCMHVMHRLYGYYLSNTHVARFKNVLSWHHAGAGQGGW